MAREKGVLLVILTAALLLISGCRSLGLTGDGSAKLRPPDPSITGPDLPVAPPPPEPEPDVVIRPKVELPAGCLTDVEKQKIVRNALLDLQRMFVLSRERLALSSGVKTCLMARDAVQKRLAELGFMVIQNAQDLPFAPSERQQDQFRRMCDCNLAILIDSEATKLDRFGNFWSFQSEAMGKVLNLTTHQIIAQTSTANRGKRALDERAAAESAQRASAAELATYLTDEVARKWEATSLVKVEVSVKELATAVKAEKLRVELLERPGVYYVSTEGWDADSECARYEVLCRFDVREGIVGYIEQLDKGKVDILEIGDAITAERKGLW